MLRLGSLDWGEIAAWLADYRAGNDVLDHPKGDQFAEKEGRAKLLIKANFKLLISSMFADMEIIGTI